MDFTVLEINNDIKYYKIKLGKYFICCTKNNRPTLVIQIFKTPLKGVR